MTARPAGNTEAPPVARLPAWAVLEQAIAQRRSVSACYHAGQHTVCPHALGWKAGRAKILVCQSEPTTTREAIAVDPRQQWRSMFVDEIEDPVITDDPWHSADNYTPICNNIDEVEIDINSHPRSQLA